MLSFIQYILEVALSSSGNSAEYHAAKYLDPFIGGHETVKHVLNAPTQIGDTVHPTGTEITIHATRDERNNRLTRGKRGAFHSVVSVNGGPRHEIANSRIKKPNLGNPNADNKAFADAFEAYTAYRVHQMATHNNDDPAHKQRISHIHNSFNEAAAKIPIHLKERAKTLGERAANAYMSSLQRQGITNDDIEEVHWTNKGISGAIGRSVDRRNNPHDIMIKYKKSDGTHAWHGASLKASEGTASNNGLEAFDTHSVFNGNNTNLQRAWTGQKNGQVAAQHHVTMFNSGTLEDKKNHLHYLLKSRPDVSYHYVIADQGKSTPIEDHPVIKAINAAENIRAVHKGTNVHFYDQDGKHLAMVEHRRPGKARSPQANAKFGNLNKEKNKTMEKSE